MPESRAARRPLRRTVLGPVAATAALAGLAITATAGSVLGAGWVLTWLLLGLTAGYALSGSA